jgi:hypothetical protein
MLEIYLEENKDYQGVENFWPVKIVNYNQNLNEEILIPRKNIEVPDRIILNRIIHGYYIDCRD